MSFTLASFSYTTQFFFPPFSLSDIGRIKFSTQIQERTWDDFVEGHLITLLSWSLTSFLLVLNMLTPFFPFPPPPSKQTLHWPVWVLWCIWSFSQNCLLPNLRRFVPSANFTNLPVRVDIYILTAPNSSDQASEFLMKKMLVPGSKYLTAENFQKTESF